MAMLLLVALLDAIVRRGRCFSAVGLDAVVARTGAARQAAVASVASVVTVAAAAVAVAAAAVAAIAAVAKVAALVIAVGITGGLGDVVDGALPDGDGAASRDEAAAA